MRIKQLIKYFFAAILLYFVICNIVFYLFAQQKPESNADTMVILGAKVVGNPAVLHRTLRGRLDVAVTYLENNPQTKVIVCGGQGKDESATEASVMENYLISKGITSTRIYREEMSTRTAHQFLYANKIIPLGKTVVVTSDFHLLRSIMLAKRSGVEDVSGLSAPVEFDNHDKLLALWREPLALINYWLFDHPQ